MGIVPGEYTTGGKQKLLGISKRGNKYLRRLFVQGARSVLQQRHKQAPRSERVARATAGANAPECCRRGLGQQAGSHGLGGLVQERTLSRSRFCGDNLTSLFRENSSCQVCWRKIKMAMGLSHAFETRSRKRSLPGRPVYEDASERISIMARSR